MKRWSWGGWEDAILPPPVPFPRGVCASCAFVWARMVMVRAEHPSRLALAPDQCLVPSSEGHPGLDSAWGSRDTSRAALTADLPLVILGTQSRKKSTAKSICTAALRKHRPPQGLLSENLGRWVLHQDPRVLEGDGRLGSCPDREAARSILSFCRGRKIPYICLAFICQWYFRHCPKTNSTRQ